MLRCRHPARESQRENLLYKACTVLPTFNILNDTDKLVFLLSNANLLLNISVLLRRRLGIRVYSGGSAPCGPTHTWPNLGLTTRKDWQYQHY